MDWGKNWFVDVNAGKSQLVSFDWSNNNGSIDVKMNGSLLEKSFFKMLGLTFSSKLDCGYYIISIAKTTSKKIGALIRSMKILSPEAALYLYNSTIRPCMECCFLIDCMIFLSPFLVVTKMSMSTVSFLAQLDYGILCLWNAFI